MKQIKKKHNFKKVLSIKLLHKSNKMQIQTFELLAIYVSLFVSFVVFTFSYILCGALNMSEAS